MAEFSGAPCVELRNVVKRFSRFTAVDHLDLTVQHGKVFSILGPSGCGKTTTLRMVAGLEKPDEGEILIDGKVVNDISPHKRECSLVFQNLAVFPHLTVGKNVAYGLERRKVSKTEIRKAVGEILELVGLSGLEDRRPNQLSGGQLQRVALARSLVLRPRILLLDEPMAALDRKLRKEMQVELKRIQREIGITFLYVTHDQKVALSISDIIAVMHDGKLEQIGTASAIYEVPRTAFVADFIGSANIFLGRVTSRSQCRVYLEAENGIMLVGLDLEDTPPQKIVGISIHPELVGVSRPDAEINADNKLPGKIIEMIYQGDFIETIICLNRGSKLMTAYLRRELSEGSRFSTNDDILVHWDAKSGNILLG